MQQKEHLLTVVPYSSADYPFVCSLYESAFPVYERRSRKQLLNMLLQKEMQVLVAKHQEEPVGFAIYWHLQNWLFIEHIAIHPAFEGKGYGSTVIRYLIEKSDRWLLLETELPTDEVSRRRIRFYEKLGLQIAPFRYRQPPYRNGETTPSMHIMSIPAIQQEAEFNRIAAVIRQQVFEAYY